jgi:hypothetical protein
MRHGGNRNALLQNLHLPRPNHANADGLPSRISRPIERPVVKSHDHENAVLYTQRLLNIYATVSKPKKCLLITAVRDPATWLLSKFMQDRGQRMGYCESTSITPREALDDYKSWISKSAALNRHRAQ